MGPSYGCSVTDGETNGLVHTLKQGSRTKQHRILKLMHSANLQRVILAVEEVSVSRARIVSIREETRYSTHHCYVPTP